MSSVVTLYRAGTSGAALEPHRVVQISGGKIIHTAAVGNLSIGVTGYVVPDATNLPVDYAVAGIVDVQCAGPIPPGTRLAGAADGKVTPAAAGNSVIGLALNETASAQDDIIQMLIAPGVH